LNLSETYKVRLKGLAGILEEKKSKIEYEYQVRDIGGDVYYKRKNNSKEWEFTNELDFFKNSKKSNVVKWEKLKDKNAPKIRQIEVEQDLNYKKYPLETYKRYLENICPSNFNIEIKDGYIKIFDKINERN
jgi:hypothetical protein